MDGRCPLHVKLTNRVRNHSPESCWSRNVSSISYSSAVVISPAHTQTVTLVLIPLFGRSKLVVTFVAQ